MLGFRNLRIKNIVRPLRHPPVLFAGALVIAGSVIAANALFMQPRRHPAPLVATRDVVVPEPPPAPRRADELVLAVQAALRRVGYYSGSLDGVPGPKTHDAIVAFEAAVGRPQTGVASLDLLAAIEAVKAGDVNSLNKLASGEKPAPAKPAPAEQQMASADPAPADPTGAGPASTGSLQPDRQVAAVQHALDIAAYGPVKADGIPGPETEQAVKRFQHDHGLPETGEISDSLIVELRSVGALGQ